MTFVDDAYEAGWPVTNVNLSASNPAHVTNGAPLTRLQVLQWQWVIPYAGPDAR
jgi:hypothetical protein